MERLTAEEAQKIVEECRNKTSVVEHALDIIDTMILREAAVGYANVKVNIIGGGGQQWKDVFMIAGFQVNAEELKEIHKNLHDRGFMLASTNGHLRIMW